MERNLLLFCILFAALFPVLISSASFLSNALGSHMVLQRAPRRAQIWGWSSKPGSKVTTAFRGVSYAATSGTDGLWSILFDPTPAGGPYSITVTSDAGEKATITDVLFGDVWVCSGQSNMQFTVDSAFNASEEVKAAAAYPNIRLFTVGQGTYSENVTLNEFKTIEQPWSVASPETVGHGNWSAFSAACWFFGRNVYDNLKVPLGLVSDNWGGTPVQAWSSPDALRKCPQQQEPHPMASQNDPSVLWNAMIVPILRMTITGALWYQGEANTGHANYYACAFPAMIEDWRQKWSAETDKQFGFYYVQLAPWIGDNTAEAEIRLAQVYANQLPNVGVATAMDWGDPTAPYGSVHPRYKQIVGYRLSLVGLGLTYKLNVQYLGPNATRWVVTSDGPNARVGLTFDEASIGGGLVYEQKSCDAGVPETQCAGFEIGTEDGKWTPALGSISGVNVIVTANVGSAKKVTGVRYGWSTFPLATIYNKEGLPLLPFAFPNPIKPV